MPHRELSNRAAQRAAYITLFVGVVPLAFLLLGIGWLTQHDARTIAAAEDKLVAEGGVPLIHISHVAVAFQGLRITSRDLLSAEDPTSRGAFVAKLGVQKQAFWRELDVLGTSLQGLNNADARVSEQHGLAAAFQDLRNSSQAYSRYLAELERLAAAHQEEKAWELLHSVPYAAVIDAQGAAIAHLEALQLARVSETASNNARQARTSLIQIGAAIVFALLCTIAAGFGGFRGIRQMVRAQSALQDSENRFQLTAAATNDVFWDWNVLTN